MWPHEHVLFAVIPVSAYIGVRYRRLPSGFTLLLLLVATQLPDIIDKPIAWWFNVFPSGRMLAHSVFIFVPLLGLGYILARRWGWGRRALLFSGAYLSHIVGDFYPILWLGTEYYFFPNLFWPLLTANPDHTPSFAAHMPADRSALLVPIGILCAVLCYIVVDIVRDIRAENVQTFPY